MKINMKIRSFLLLSALAVCMSFSTSVNAQTTYYQFKIYHLSKAQEPVVENYLKSAYIPALKKAGIANVGVFKLITPDTLDNKLYVFVPYNSLTQFDNVNSVLAADNQYKVAGKEYLEALSTNRSYGRIESILLRAFSAMPKPAVPKLNGPKAQRVYELRSYESPSETLAATKIKQFTVGNKENGSELDIFTKHNFNAVFYAEVISGSKMPNLMYMTTFNNAADQEAHWALFNNDPNWAVLRRLPEYGGGTVSKNERTYLYPVEYSDF